MCNGTSFSVGKILRQADLETYYSPKSFCLITGSEVQYKSGVFRAYDSLFKSANATVVSVLYKKKN